MRSTNQRRARGNRGRDEARGSGGSGRREPGDEPTARENLYDTVTRRIVAELEQGRVPWVQPWGRVGGAGAGLPRNALAGRPDSGINILILWGAVIEHGYPSQGWLTFAQALQAGGAVRKGERGTTLVYADRFVPKDADKKGRRSGAVPPNGREPPETDAGRARETGDGARSVAFLKRFSVFNVLQIDGLPEGFADDPAPLLEREIVPVAERLIAASGVPIRIGGDKAFYVPSLDLVQVPPQPAFFDQINYYRTCLHELTHATGHPSRLARDVTSAFGSKDYAREELVAEMGSAFLCAALGIVPTVRHADYLASWLEVLRADSRVIFGAASAASKAADWLLARHHEAETATARAAA